MENFTIYNPTILHFGKEVLATLGSTVKEYGNKVLLVYGKGSIKKNGLYDKIINQLEKAGLVVYEYSGIRPNPIIEDVDAAAKIGRQQQVDVILAVGGGSVADSAKIISIAIPVDHSGWSFFTGQAKPAKAIPVITVLTLAATGSEMNPFAVISNHDSGQKSAFGSPMTFPKHSFLDPQLTTTVPSDYTAYGIADLIAHCFEAWFGVGESTLSDRFVISIVQEAMKQGPLLLKDLTNYDLRAKIMFAATMALNGTTMLGRVAGDWGVHSVGHCLSFLYNVPHGASLTIVYPAWLKYYKNHIPDRIAQLGSDLFHTPLSTDDSIKRIEGFFRSVNCPTHLSDLNILGDQRQAIYESMVINKVTGANMKLKESDYEGLIDLFL